MKQIHLTKHTSRSRLLALLAALMMTLSLLSCSANEAMMDNMPSDYTYAETEAYAPAPGAMADAAFDKNYVNAKPAETTAASAAQGDSGTKNPDPTSGRKLIKNVSMDMETLEFDAFTKSLDARIAACGGYVQSSSISGSGKNRYANVTARIPAEKLDEFCTGVAEIANVTMRSENTSDVTLSYYDMESHVKALRSEYDTLIGILEKCTELKDVISVQSRITEVLYQIESYQSRLNNYDNLVAYSTVNLYIYEVERETIVEDPTIGVRISDGLSRTMDDISRDIEDGIVSFTTNLPYTVIWVAIIGASILILRMLIRRAKRRKAEKKANTANSDQ